MSDRDALLAAVLADPDDDLPRLVFADHLDESGHPADAARAQFIRLQIEAERHPDVSRARKELLAAAEELWVLHAGWSVGRLPWLSWGDSQVRFRRGFVEELTCTLRRFASDAAELLGIEPVTAVRLRSRNYAFRRSRPPRDEPYLSRLTTLHLGPHLLNPNADPHVLFLRGELRNLSRLSVLGFAGNDLDDNWLIGFARCLPECAFADSLAELDLSDNRLTDSGASLLYSAAGFDRLSRLVLVNNRIAEVGRLLLRQRFGERVVL